MLCRHTLLLAATLLGLLTPCLELTAAPDPPAATALRHGAAAGGATHLTFVGLSGLGPLERQLVAEVLDRLRRAVARAPAGKRVRHILVEPFDVFTRDDLFPDFVNALHATTRHDVVRARLTFEEGAAYDQLLVDESRRILMEPQVLTTVAIVPLVTEDDGVVDVLVVTKDMWSLRFNSNFQLTGSHLDFLAASVSENNFLGRHKHLAASFLVLPDVLSIGPTYIDPHLLGSRLVLDEATKFAFNLDTGAFEGAFGALQVGLPLYTRNAQWGWSAALGFRHHLVRQYSGGELLPFRTDDAPESPSMPWLYRDRALEVVAALTRSHGTSSKVDTSWGWVARLRSPQVPNAARYDPELVAQFQDFALPRGRRESYPFVSVRAWSPTYETYVDYETLGISEDKQVGHDALFAVGVGHPLTGSDGPFVKSSASASYATTLVGDDRLAIQTSATHRLVRGQSRDVELAAGLRFASPMLTFFRIHIAAEGVMHLWHRDHTLVGLGGNNGLRGYLSERYVGPHRVRANVELRSRGFELWSTFIGGVLFWDGGDAFEASDASDLVWHNGVGLGLRWLIPQFNRVVIRIDWGFPVGPNALPGSSSLGFEQAF